MENLYLILSLQPIQKKKMRQRGINSINAFLDWELGDMRRTLDTDVNTLKDMKSMVIAVLRPEVVKGSTLLKESCLLMETLKTRIRSVDEILPSRGIAGGEIIEVTGPPAGGKSMLLNTIMINVLENDQDLTIMYIDTKCSFSIIKLKNLMIARGMPEEMQVHILKRIELERNTTPEDIIKTLEFINNTPLQHEKLKLVIINSITAPFYLYLGHTLVRLDLMTKVSELMKVLANRKVSVN